MLSLNLRVVSELELLAEQLTMKTVKTLAELEALPVTLLLASMDVIAMWGAIGGVSSKKELCSVHLYGLNRTLAATLFRVRTVWFYCFTHRVILRFSPSWVSCCD